MAGFILAPAAQEDLLQIWWYLYESATTAVADRVESELYRVFTELAATPGQGHTRADLTSHPVLFFTLYSYMVVYRPGTPLEIVRVLHGKRDLKRILDFEP
jgi:plasmid stabilization system protein ParE